MINDLDIRQKIIEKNFTEKIDAKNVLFLVGLSPETISELRLHFSVAFNSLSSDKIE
jgi:hypothetical protein